MKKGWEIKKFEDCLEKVVYTKKIPRKDFHEVGEYPIISQEHEFVNGFWNNSNDLFKVKKPIVIFGDHTKVLKYVDFDFVLGADGVKILEPKNSIDTRFFFYFLQNINLGNLGYARHFRLLKEISVIYPTSIEEQQEIVSILDDTFELIERAKSNVERNLRNARELFDSYLQNIFENKGKDWEEKTLGEACKVERGSSPRPIDKFFTDDIEGVNWIKIGDTKHVDKYIYTTRQKITKDGALQSRFVDIDDFILSNSMSFGKPFIMKTQGYIHDGWFVLRLPKNIDTEFFWYLLASPYTMNQFVSLASGAIVKNISGDLVKKTILPIPPLNDQKNIVKKLDDLSIETKRLEDIYQQKLNDLEDLKKSILQKAFNGEIKTSKASAL
jgi:type I restriction enzyme S subunit